MDNNYEERVLARRQIMAEHPSTVMGAIPAGHDSVRELYSFLLSEYLPERYPSMFSLEEDGAVFRNQVTKRTFPTAAPVDPLECFRVIGETVEDDVFLLKETDEGHLSVAFLCCHPAGFDPSTKLGKLLKDIHAPVPSYDKIGPSMERFFSKVKAGQFVKRLNVSLPHIYNLAQEHKGRK
jgi:heme-dependent oxidative N-demethylase alpha subunit-like protein